MFQRFQKQLNNLDSAQSSQFFFSVYSSHIAKECYNYTKRLNKKLLFSHIGLATKSKLNGCAQNIFLDVSNNKEGLILYLSTIVVPK